MWEGVSNWSTEAMTTNQESFQRVSSGGGVTTAPEKPFHYTYLKEFRVEQCKLFLQHKCTQHRPYTCFYWHFMNQKRRRPIRKRDGTFTYSPDVYCAMYDENTGICPNGEDCTCLHRNAGDTERRYHLRYYKTSTCVYETDSRGFCVKNGPHCAFAHGPHDLRSPVYDIRETTGEVEEDRLLSPLVGSLEREKGVLVDDPRWHDSSFVLTYYKTDICKRPPRLCRQGYACPFYHNNKDRRRGPKLFKYRSTPCPNVKVNDEWSDPVHCEQGDQCCYCHTRTEQQFHPEIYKSTRCNDVQATGYCPRGPFCAFAHDDKELSAPRELTEEPMGMENVTTILESTDIITLPQPIGSQRPSSAATPTHPDIPPFQRAPGAEVRSKSLGEEDSQAYIRKQLHAIDSDISLEDSEKQRRKQNLLRLSFGSLSAAAAAGFSPDSQFQPGSLPSSVSDALEIIGQSLEDLTIEELDPNVQLSGGGIDMGMTDTENLNTSTLGQSPVAHGFLQTLQSPFSTSLSYNTPLGPLSPFSAPQSLQSSFGVQTTPTSPLTSAAMSPVPGQSRVMTMAQIVTQSSGGGMKAPSSPQRPTTMIPEKQEIHSLKEEIKQSRAHLSSWQDSWKQAKQACDAWRKEAEEASSRASKEKERSAREKEELESQIKQLRDQLYSTKSLRVLAEGVNLLQLPLSELEDLRSKIRRDLDRLDSSINARRAMLCLHCNELPRSVLFQPCQHCLLCQKCAEALHEPICPHCNARVAQKVTVLIPSL